MEPVDKPIFEENDVDITLDVPEWMKDRAEMWSQNQINDETFIQGIEFLIQKQIIDFGSEVNVSISLEEKIKNKLESTEKTVEQTSEIPSWIQSSAHWWAEGQLSDSEFLDGLKWLIQKEIILII